MHRKAKIEELNRSILPKGVQLIPYYDRSWLVDNTLKTVFKNLGEGALLVCLVLYLFLGRILTIFSNVGAGFVYVFDAEWRWRKRNFSCSMGAEGLPGSAATSIDHAQIDLRSVCRSFDWQFHAGT